MVIVDVHDGLYWRRQVESQNQVLLRLPFITVSVTDMCQCVRDPCEECTKKEIDHRLFAEDSNEDVNASVNTSTPRL